jgi:hypothetical protein
MYIDLHYNKSLELIPSNNDRLLPFKSRRLIPVGCIQLISDNQSRSHAKDDIISLIHVLTNSNPPWWGVAPPPARFVEIPRPGDGNSAKISSFP